MQAAQANLIPFVDLAAQYRTIAAEIQAAIGSVLDNSTFILGRPTAQFEENFARFAGTRHAVGVSSGLAALELSLRALGIGAGDEVILPANTFIATALAVSSVGARPVVVDCDRATFNIDPAQAARAITPRTKAIIPVHLFGQPAEMDAISEMAARHRIAVVEDAAQAHGALYKGRPCGSMGDVGCFSFYPSKNLGAYGDGGAVITNREDLAERLRVLGNYGEKAKYEHVEKGTNARLDALQAAILDVKLRHLPEWNCARARHAEKYRQFLSDLPEVGFQQALPGTTHVYHLFVIEVEQRDALRAYLVERGVQTGIHYPIPIHLQQAYADLGYQRDDFPNAEALARRMLSLPMYAELTEGQVEFICLQIRSFVRGTN